MRDMRIAAKGFEAATNCTHLIQPVFPVQYRHPITWIHPDLKLYLVALAASIMLHLLLFWLPSQTRDVPRPEIVKLGIQLEYSELASRRQSPQKKVEAPQKSTTKQPVSSASQLQQPPQPEPKTAAKSLEQVAPAPTGKQANTASTPRVPPDTRKPQKVENTKMASADTAPDLMRDERALVNPAKVPVEKSAAIEAEEHISPPRFQLGSINNPKPGYPALARNRGWEGDVIIGVHVAADGSVEHLEIMKSSHFGPLDHAAWETVKNEWTFEPALSDGEYVPAFVEVPISFRLQKPEEPYLSSTD